METGIDLNAVLEMLRPLSDSNKCWLADRLYEEAGLRSRGHAYVDMGLSVKWATCNVGASNPGDHGNYYAWGETKLKPSYDEDNCETWEEKIGDIGGTSRDVAHVKWGGGWRMPTLAESADLSSDRNCTWKWIDEENFVGYRVTSKKTGNSIFLPDASWRCGEEYHSVSPFYDEPRDVTFWTSTPEYDRKGAYSFSDGVCLCYRWFGLPVRPVLE